MGITKEKAIDILDKIDFFQGQRAGRELWNEKSRYVQELDLKHFQEDVALLREYIAEAVPKSEVEKLEAYIDDLNDSKEHLCVMLEEAKADVEREIFEEIDELIFQHGRGDLADKYFYLAMDELKKKYTEGGKC